MPDFVKKLTKTEEILHLHMGVGNKTLIELQDLMTKRIAGLIKRHGPDAKVELIGYSLYVTLPEHLESDREYNERIIKEVQQGK